jgi:hypothetical protein
MTEVVVILLVVVGFVALLMHIVGGKNRYAEMTEEEFEEEAKKGSVLGAALMGVEGALRKREATVLMEAKKVEAEETRAAGEPPKE